MCTTHFKNTGLHFSAVTMVYPFEKSSGPAMVPIVSREMVLIVLRVVSFSLVILCQARGVDSQPKGSQFEAPPLSAYLYRYSSIYTH